MNQYKILTLALVFFISLHDGMAQSNRLERKEQRKIEKAEKKRLKEEERIERQELLKELVQEQAFVLEASTIYGKYMYPYQVQPNTNFVKIEGNQVTIQTASNFSLGYNGLGGITINGVISDYKVASKNNDGFTVLIQLTNPVLGHSTLNLSLGSGGSARALLVDNWGRRLTFQGQISNLENTSVFEGSPII